MKKRLLYYQLIQHLDHKNALIITGMRQVGKTTLARQIFDGIESGNKLWFDFDNPLDQKIFEDIDYKIIYERLKKAAGNHAERLYIFIDEIQNFPEITKVIKYLLDHFGVKFVVTGSSNYYLKNLFPESLSGRKFLYHLPPLGFQEYLYFLDKITLAAAQAFNLASAWVAKDIVEYKKFSEPYNDYLQFGGFPEVVLTTDAGLRVKILNNIFASFFEKDLKILSDYSEVRELRDLILLLVPRVGSALDVTKLGSELGVSRAKIYHYLEFLQGTFFIRLLPRFSKSIDRAVAGGKKVYFTDTGLLNIVGPVNDGQLLENAVINQLAEQGEISYYYKKNTAELDIIFNKKIALEVKLTASPSDMTRAKQLAKRLGISEAYVISKNFVAFPQTVYPMFL